MRLAEIIARSLHNPANHKWIIATLLSIGAIGRLVWALHGHWNANINESHNVATAIARSGRFADVFIRGGGPTAHIGMFTPLPAALAYWIFGEDSKPAETALILWDIGLVTATCWLGWRLLITLRSPPITALLAVAFVAIVPIQFSLEVYEGRDWEVALAATILLGILLYLAKKDGAETHSSKSLAILGAASGFLFIVSPAAGLASVAAVFVFHCLRVSLPRWWIAPACFLVVAGSLGATWAIRNNSQLGKPIILRDNLGLEMALANFPGMLESKDEKATYLSRLREIHPLFGAIDKLNRAGGEVPYYSRLGAKARAWIATNKLEFLELCARRFKEFYFPPRWFWYTFGEPGGLTGLRQYLVWATTFGGIATLLVMVWLQRTYRYLAAAILVCCAPYVVVQPILRYRYLISSLLIFLAFDGLSRLINLRASSRAKMIGQSEN